MFVFDFSLTFRSQNRYCSRINLPQSVVQLASEIARKAFDKLEGYAMLCLRPLSTYNLNFFFFSKSPSSIASAAIYMAARQNDREALAKGSN